MRARGSLPRAGTNQLAPAYLQLRLPWLHPPAAQPPGSHLQWWQTNGVGSACTAIGLSRPALRPALQTGHAAGLTWGGGMARSRRVGVGGWRVGTCSSIVQAQPLSTTVLGAHTCMQPVYNSHSLPLLARRTWRRRAIRVRACSDQREQTCEGLIRLKQLQQRRQLRAADASSACNRSCTCQLQLHQSEHALLHTRTRRRSAIGRRGTVGGWGVARLQRQGVCGMQRSASHKQFLCSRRWLPASNLQPARLDALSDPGVHTLAAPTCGG